MERRQALTLLVHGGSAVIAIVVGVPTLIYAIAPGRRDEHAAVWRDVGLLEEFPIGEVTASLVQHEREEGTGKSVPQRATLRPGIYVWRLNEEETIVFSRSCTDLGCPVTFDRGSECFLCPCHGGIFSKQGDRMAGPPDRPLYRYLNRVHEGVLQVDLTSVPPMI
jgi:menaquinol-cytochrome c reductase iron-sulfur subunit